MSTRDGRIEDALILMRIEAKRALDKHGPENTMDAPHKSDSERLAILVEEVGKVAKELTYDRQGTTYTRSPHVLGEDMVQQFGAPAFSVDGELLFASDMDDDQLTDIGWSRTTARQRLRKELVQVGAVAATWAAMLGEEQA